MQNIINVVAFVLILGTIIMVHELGHFIAAKSFGVFCGEFSLGMGPSLWHTKKGETEYHLRALPIGGYVAMAGEVDQEDNEAMKDVPFERTIKGISTWKQVVVMSAGVFMNFVLAFLLMVTVNVTSTQMALNTNEVGSVVTGGTAEQIGLESGDLITNIHYLETNQSYEVLDWEGLGTALAFDTHQINAPTTDVIITIDRAGNLIEKEATLTYQAETNNYLIGIQMATRDLTFGESIKYAVLDIADMSTLIMQTLVQLVTDAKNTIGQLSGPAGIYQVTSDVTQTAVQTGSMRNILLLVAMLSVNIGVFNLMPIPGLDGSQILFAIVEKIMGREIPPKFRGALQLAGLILVFGLMIIVTIQDITKLF